VVARLKPAMVTLIERVFGSNLQHDIPERGHDRVLFGDSYAIEATR
jgi:hypothetical protein